MKTCFADTSYFLALLIPTDANHAVARRWADQNRLPLTTSDYVVVEVANFLSGIKTRLLFTGFLKALRSDRRVTIAPASSHLLERGIDLYQSRTDKSWSLTDCISFEIMREHGITEVLATDRHFAQAGFSQLLSPLS